jgi:hypothetical protein
MGSFYLSNKNILWVRQDKKNLLISCSLLLELKTSGILSAENAYILAGRGWKYDLAGMEKKVIGTPGDPQ